MLMTVHAHKKNVLGLQTAEPPGQSAEPPGSVHSEHFQQTREHQFKLSLHTAHKEKSYMPLFYPSKSTNQSLLPCTLPQYFSPFGINLQKGSLHQKEEMMVDK
jgi:hypothetical protein